MAVCAVCQAPCRGTCAKCGARLCAQHRPTSARAKCPICKKLGTGLVQAVQAIPPYPTSSPSAQPASAAKRSSAGALETLPLADQLAWIDARRIQLLTKRARERAYLNRRAQRGTRTPTDEAYEADAVLETELLEALDLLESLLQGGSPPPPPAGPARPTYAGDTSILFPLPGPHDKLQP